MFPDLSTFFKIFDLDIKGINIQVFNNYPKPSESSAPNYLIRLDSKVWKETNEGKKIDNSAWMVHEIAHVLASIPFKNDDYHTIFNPKVKSAVAKLYHTSSYQKVKELFKEFGDDSYPNTDVERFTFGMQFLYLLKHGSSINKILEIMHEEYKNDGEDIWISDLKPKFEFMLNNVLNN